MSNLSWDKGLGIVLELFTALDNEGLDVRFELAGPATGSELLAIESASARSNGRLNWRGPVYGDDKVAYLRALDVFCFPTMYKNEAQPLVLFEAVACGVPVLAYARGCISESIGSDFGQVVPVNEDFLSAVIPTIRAWVKDRESMEAQRFRAWSRYAPTHEEATASLAIWLDFLVNAA